LKISSPDANGKVAVTFGHVVIDLDKLAPMAAGSPSPDNIKAISELAGQPVGQVVIGSCTNSSYQDLLVSTGMGIRIYLGYFLLRIDTAWEYDGQGFSKPRYLFSLGGDF